MAQAGRAEEDPYDDPDEEDPYDNIEAGASEEFTQASDQSNTDENPAWPSRPTILKKKGRPPVPPRKPSSDGGGSTSASSGTPPRTKPPPPPKPRFSSGSIESSPNKPSPTPSQRSGSNPAAAPPPLPPRNDALVLAGWFRKAPERQGFGSSKLRYFELHGKEIRYFTGVGDDGAGSGLKGKIDTSGEVEIKVAGRSLAITTGSRYWSLTAESDTQAQQWGDALMQRSNTATDKDETEVDMLPAHGDWMLKRGKGIGKYADDKVRYFTLVHVRETGRLRINYYVQLAGRARVPLNQKGFIAIDYSSRIIRTDRKLQIANPGFTWQLTCYSMATAKRWERILANAIAENVHLNEAEANGADTADSSQLPILARAHELVTASGRTPDLQTLMSTLRSEYDETKVDFWHAEIANTLSVYEGTARRPTFAAEPGPELCAWFTKQGRIAGKRAWYELEGTEIKWYKSPPSIEQSASSRSGTAAAVAMRAHAANAPAFLSNIVGGTSSGTGLSSMDQERGTLVLTRETTVDCNVKDHTLYISTGSQSAWLVADSGTVAVDWAESIRKAVGLYGLTGNDEIPNSPTMRRAVAPPIRPRVAPRPSLRHADRPTRPLSLYEVFDEGEDDTVDVVGRAKVLYEYTQRSENEMSLKADEVISLLTADEASGWWEGVTTVAGILRTGWFPAAYVSRIEWSKENRGSVDNQAPLDKISEEPKVTSLYVDTDDDEDVEAGADMADPEGPESAESKEAAKEKKLQRTIEEIVQTERDYVKKLFCMGKGYVTPMRPLVGELFDESAIGTLFCNLEQLLQGQTAFLERLEVAAETKDPGKVADAFSESLSTFRLYSPYCNNHPRAVEMLEQLVAEDDRIWSFFEGCRMMLDGELSVSALMIKPVQRICQYPMLLAELEKRTEGTPANEKIKEAGVLLREIALTINEEKRKQEEVRALSEKFDGWNGPPLTVYSSVLFCQGFLKKISGNVAHDRYCFLLDNLVVMTRRNVASDRYKVTGTMFTHGCTLADVPDGEYTHSKAPIYNAFRVYNIEKDKWYIMVAKSPAEKTMWVDGFEAESKHTAANAESGLNLVEMSSSEIGALHGVKGKKMQRKKKGQSTRVKRKVSAPVVPASASM